MSKFSFVESAIAIFVQASLSAGSSEFLVSKPYIAVAVGALFSAVGPNGLVPMF
jgi:hypothetical protein